MSAFLKSIYRKVAAAALASAAALVLNVAIILTDAVPVEYGLVVQALAPAIAGFLTRESKVIDPSVVVAPAPKA